MNREIERARKAKVIERARSCLKKSESYLQVRESDYLGNSSQENKVHFTAEESKQNPEIRELWEWAVEAAIPMDALNELLTILRRQIPSLPKSGEAFLKATFDTEENQ